MPASAGSGAGVVASGGGVGAGWGKGADWGAAADGGVGGTPAAPMTWAVMMQLDRWWPAGAKSVALPSGEAVL
jgi:hypothetical protein